MRCTHIFYRFWLLALVMVLAVGSDALAELPRVLRTASTREVVESVWASVRLKFPVPADTESDAPMGLGLVFVQANQDEFPSDFSWDEPNFEHSIGIGFDVHNPPPTDIEPDENGRVKGWFDEPGNWYDRPQREISVHANGQELANVLSGYEYRTGEWVEVMVQLRYILGGAHVVVLLNGHVVVDEKIWGVEPMKLRAMLGVVGEGIWVDNLQIVRQTPLIRTIPEPVSVMVFDEVLLTNAARLKSEVDFSKVPDSVGRVIATLRLSEPEVGYDHWDKKGTIGITVPGQAEGEPGERFEVFRFITPYRRGWSWKMDVTDLLPLFADQRTLDAYIETYMKGWDVSFTLDFYPGKLDREPIAVMNLWTGDAEIGNPDKPVEAFYMPRTVSIPEEATHARVRTTVTGHGMSPNSNNAGEFMPIWRTLTISSQEPGGDVLAGDFIKQSARDHLWNTDVYLNPCRPQGGTWKFDRAGWAPGSKVEPWIVDVQPEFVFGETLTIEYALDPYLNAGRGETWAPHHWTDAVVVFYK